jgi:hypothetical protein
MKTCRSPLWAILALGSGVSLAFAIPAAAAPPGQDGAGTPILAFSQARAAVSSGPFNEIWTVALSQYDQAVETGDSLTQLSNGTIVVGGGDSNLHNYCSTRKNPLYGGAWLVAASPSSGSNVWQNLYSTCASSAQTTSSVSGTADGGLILAGGDFDNPACGNGCGW